MKHLKPFNESKENLVEDLQDFCETSLAYLYDEGYNVSLSIRDQVKYPGVNHIVVSLGLPNENYVALRPYDGYRKFHWNDVKDYYIPFLQMLQRRYELIPYLDDTSQVYLQFNTISGFRYLSLDQVINDRTGLDHNLKAPLWGINIKIQGKI
jgi:hypothetical protein